MPDQIEVRSVKNGTADTIEVPTRDEALIEAYLRERAGYRQYGRHDQAAEVDVELARLGYVETTEPTDKGANNGRDTDRQPARRRPAAGRE